MNEKTITAQELLELEAEMKAFLKEKLGLDCKFEVTHNLLRIKDLCEMTRNMANDIFKEHGTLNEQTQLVEMPMFEDKERKIKTPAWLEIEKIYEKKVPFECIPISTTWLKGVQTDNNYPLMFEYIFKPNGVS